MDRGGTGLRENLSLVYKNYGGWRSLIASEYFYASIFLVVICWRWVLSEEWLEFAKTSVPVLSGFSMAAYAVFFAVLDDNARKLLRAPAESLGRRSPLLVLASSISHAIIVQLTAVIVALVFDSKPFPTLSGLEQAAMWVNIIASAVGLFFTFYGILLVLASVLSIFRIIEIQSK